MIHYFAFNCTINIDIIELLYCTVLLNAMPFHGAVPIARPNEGNRGLTRLYGPPAAMLPPDSTMH